MYYGSGSLIYKPTKEQQTKIINEMKILKRKGKLEMSFDASDEEPKEDEEFELPECDQQVV
jgi:hypothetical protein